MKGYTPLIPLGTETTKPKQIIQRTKNTQVTLLLKVAAVHEVKVKDATGTHILLVGSPQAPGSPQWENKTQLDGSWVRSYMFFSGYE